jgi:hypothetical protein
MAFVPGGQADSSQARSATGVLDIFHSVAQSGLKSVARGKPRVNPGLSYFGHFGPRIGNIQAPGHLGRLTGAKQLPKSGLFPCLFIASNSSLGGYEENRGDH